MPKIISRKPTKQEQLAAEKLSASLMALIMVAPDWNTAHRLMVINNKVMRMYGWFEPGYGFRKFR